MVKTSPSKAWGAGSIPGQGAKIPHASGPKNQNIKQKQYCKKLNKDFKSKIKQNERSRKVSLCDVGSNSDYNAMMIITIKMANI